jgi:hypothetical protein
MRHTPLSLRFLAAFSFAGLAFSGYLTSVKLFTGACAFNESCPIVFGLPACFYGFGLYVGLSTLTIIALRGNLEFIRALRWFAALGTLGVLFAGSLTASELPTYLARGFTNYAFGVPTCFMGLVFFLLILATSGIAYTKERERMR